MLDYYYQIEVRENLDSDINCLYKKIKKKDRLIFSMVCYSMLIYPIQIYVRTLC